MHKRQLFNLNIMTEEEIINEITRIVEQASFYGCNLDYAEREAAKLASKLMNNDNR